MQQHSLSHPANVSLMDKPDQGQAAGLSLGADFSPAAHCCQLSVSSAVVQPGMIRAGPSGQIMLDISQLSHLPAEHDICRLSGEALQQNLAPFITSGLPNKSRSISSQDTVPHSFGQSGCDRPSESCSYTAMAVEVGERVKLQDTFPSLIQQRLAMSSFTRQPIGEQLQQLVINSQPDLAPRNCTEHLHPAGGASGFPGSSQTLQSFTVDFSSVNLTDCLPLSNNNCDASSLDRSHISPIVNVVDDDDYSNNILSASFSSVCEDRERKCSNSIPLVPQRSSSDQLPGHQSRTSSPSLSSLMWLTQPLSPTPSFSYLDPSVVMNLERDTATPEHRDDICARSHFDSSALLQGHLNPDPSYTTYHPSVSHSQGLLEYQTVQPSQHWARLPSSSISESSSQFTGVFMPSSEGDSWAFDQNQLLSTPSCESISSLQATCGSRCPPSPEQAKEEEHVAPHGPWQRRAGVFMAVHPFQNQNTFPFVSQPLPTPVPSTGLTESSPSAAASLTLASSFSPSFAVNNPDALYATASQFTCPASSGTSATGMAAASFLHSHVTSQPHDPQLGAQQLSFSFPQRSPASEAGSQASSQLPHVFGHTDLAVAQQTGLASWEQSEEQMDIS